MSNVHYASVNNEPDHPSAQTPGDFFESANSPHSGYQESAKPPPLCQKNHAKTPPLGQLFSKIQQKNTNMR